MESRPVSVKSFLLPGYFKKIGVGLMISTIAFALIGKGMHIELLQWQRDLINMTFMNLLLLGLSFIAFSRDKTEDERTVALRLNAIAWSFGCALLFVVLRPAFYWIVQESPEQLTGQYVVTHMLVLYLITYYGQKNSR